MYRRWERTVARHPRIRYHGRVATDSALCSWGTGFRSRPQDQLSWPRISWISFVSTKKKNKKFWEELIAYFPWYDTGHIENDASNNSSLLACVFVTAVTIGGILPCRCLATINGFLPSHCLATTGKTHTDTQTDGREFLITPLKWAQVPWYTRTYQVS
jgi:hypothetical protein